MKLLNKIRSIIKPFNMKTCSSCDHEEIYHRTEAIGSAYPGITCFGYSGLKSNYDKLCKCPGFIKKSNLDYLEYMADR